MGKLGSTQRYALIVGVIVIAVIVFLIASGTFELGGGGDDGDDDALALTAEQAEADDDAGRASPDAGEADGAAAEGAQTAAPAVGLQAMGSAFQFGDLRVIVTEIRLSDRVGQEGDETLALERFARLRLSARSTGLDAFTLGGSLVLIDARGRRFTPNAAATENAARIDDSRGNALTRVLQPGITTNLVVAFDVPEEAEGFRLRISGGYVEVELNR